MAIERLERQIEGLDEEQQVYAAAQAQLRRDLCLLKELDTA
jgi:hypothetical protein